MCHTLLTHNVSVSKNLRGKKNGGWLSPPTRKLDFTHPSTRIENISPPQSVQAALRVAEPVPTTKMLKKKILKTNYFPLFEQFSKKAFEVMK